MSKSISIRATLSALAFAIVWTSAMAANDSYIANSVRHEREFTTSLPPAKASNPRADFRAGGIPDGYRGYASTYTEAYGHRH